MSRGSKETAKGRQAWVLYGLVVAMLVTYAGFQASNGEAQARSEMRVGEAIDFYLDNPSLDPDDRLYRIADAALIDEIRTAHIERRAEADYRPMPERLRDRTRGRFQGLMDEAVAAHANANPAWRYGLTGDGDTPRAYLTHVFYHTTRAGLVVSLVFLAFLGFVLERMLGASAFAVLCVGSAAASAVGFTVFHSGLGVPWSGASGIVSGLVGAYAILAFSGTMLPGWLVAPAWIFVEAFFIRDAWGSGLESVPIYADGAALLAGLGFGFALPRMTKGLLQPGDDSPTGRRHALLGRVTLLRGSGKPLDALKLLEDEVAQSSGDAELIGVLWDIACDVRDPQRGVEPMLELVRLHLRGGQLGRAAQTWLEIVGQVQAFEVETQTLVRLGEALLDDGHPDDAVRALYRSLDSQPTMTSVQAQRVIRVARDLDSDLTRRAAAVALSDSTLDAARAGELRELAGGATPDGRLQEPTLSMPEPMYDDLTASVSNVSDSIGVEVVESDPSTGQGAPAATDEVEPALGTSEPAEATSNYEALDPHALDPDHLQDSFNEGLPEDLLGEVSDSASSSAPSSQSDDLSAIDPNALSPDALKADAGSLDSDSTEEMPPFDLAEEDVDALDDDGFAAQTPLAARPLRAVSGVPLVLEDASLKLEIQNRGKSRVPFDRIQALSVGAVAGLSARPVIIVDLVLNWLDVDEPELKVLRLRSDLFNPRALVPDASTPLEAMQTLLGRLLDGSGAVPIPDADSARGGSIRSYADLATYHRDALGVDEVLS